MSTADLPEPELPNVAEVLAGVLDRVPSEQRPLLIAIAERLAAERYRGWAAGIDDPERRAALLACAEREDEIARRVEGLYPEASTVQKYLLARHPELAEINRSLFKGRRIAQQFTIQARGERLGAATWRALARLESDATRAAILSSCAELEEASAVVLEGVLAAGV